MKSPIFPVIFLFDNGSLRAESTLSLRGVAEALVARTGRRVEAVSLLHSSNVPAAELAGVPARLLEPALAAFFEETPEADAVLLPLFFGPSKALVEYVPARLASLKSRFPKASFWLAPCLADPVLGEERLAQMLADRVRDVVLRDANGGKPHVVLVDHGSPVETVTAVRNALGGQLAKALGDEVAGVSVASMERREGEAFAFNEPLLATALRNPPTNRGTVVVALQFLSPGRHAGPGGDLAQICAAAESENPALRTVMTAPLAADNRLIDILVERLKQASTGRC